MKKWYRNGYFVQEVSFNFALHEFQIIRHAKVIHTITPETVEDMNRIIEALDAGEDVNGWENGSGETIAIEPATDEDIQCLVSEFVDGARNDVAIIENDMFMNEESKNRFMQTYNQVLLDVLIGFSDEIFMKIEEMRDFIKRYYSVSEHWIIDRYSTEQILKEFRIRWARDRAEELHFGKMERGKG